MSDDIPRPNNFFVRRADRVESFHHLNPGGAQLSLDLNDHEGLAIRAALDLWGLSLDPPRAGNAAVRAALKEVLIGSGLWPAPAIAEDE